MTRLVRIGVVTYHVQAEIAVYIHDLEREVKELKSRLDKGTKGPDMGQNMLTSAVHLTG